MRTLILALLFVVLLTSCKSSPESKLSQKDRIWNQRVEEFGKSALQNWDDTLANATTLKVQNVLINQNVLFKDYSLDDIYRTSKNKGRILVKFSGYDDFFLVLDIGTNTPLLERLSTGDSLYENYALIVNVNDITVPELGFFSRSDGDFSEIEISTNTSKIVYGTLLDFIKEE